MPYANASDKSLPKNVRGLSLVRRRQWLHVYNSSKGSGKSDGDAIRIANGVVKKGGQSMTTPAAGSQEAAYVGFIAEERQMGQDDAQYNPFGADVAAGRGCASCNWFVSPNACLLVAGEIAPGGLSRFYEPEVVDSPADAMAVTLVDDVGAPVDLSSWASSNEPTRPGVREVFGNARQSLFRYLGIRDHGPSVDDTIFPQKPMLMLEEGGLLGTGWTPPGRMRYWAVASNNFHDNKGVEFPARAQQEYVDWVWTDPGNNMPELQLWHTPDTRMGQADWISFDGHFLHSSGLVDAGREELARKYANDPDIAMSHGYVVVWDEQGRARAFRSYEQSILPRKYAGNSFTAFGLEESKKMAFTDPHKAFLRAAGLSDVEITARETKWERVGQALDQLGVGSHELEMQVLADAHARGEGVVFEILQRVNAGIQETTTPPTTLASGGNPSPAGAAQPAAGAQPASTPVNPQFLAIDPEQQPIVGQTPAAVGAQAGEAMPTETLTPQLMQQMVGSVVQAALAPALEQMRIISADQQTLRGQVESVFNPRGGNPQAGFQASGAAALDPRVMQIIAQGSPDAGQQANGAAAKPNVGIPLAGFMYDALAKSGNPILRGEPTETQRG